jgi:hypothetical protein
MSKDGPPASATGYRFGGLNAFHANLPSNAINPAGPVTTQGEAKARRNLSGFADYYARTRAIGQPAPTPQGVSPQRAAVLKKIKELEKKERANRSVVLREYDAFRLKWVYSGEWKSRLIEEDLVRGIAKVSLIQKSKGMALARWHGNRVLWIGWYPL